MSRKNRKRDCDGSALLVCTLAVTVLSMASIAILRSHRRSIARVDALCRSAQARCISQGLLQRSLATLRNDPKARGIVTDPNNGQPQARSELTRLSKSATRIQVFLYEASTIPAIDTVVDPKALDGKGKGGKDKGGKDKGGKGKGGKGKGGKGKGGKGKGGKGKGGKPKGG